VSVATIAIALAFAGAAATAAEPAGDGAVTFVEPLAGAPLLGEVRFRFAPPAPGVTRIEVFVGDRPIGAATAPDWKLRWTADRDADGDPVTAVAVRDGVAVGRTVLETARLGAMDRVRVDLVQLYPVVHTMTGDYVRDLTAEDFVVLEDGREVEIRHFDARPTRLSMALLLDVSRSMTDKLDRVADASIRFAEQLDPDDAVAVYAFNHRLEKIVPLTRDRTEVRERIRRLPASGGTALYDALVRVVDDLQDVPGRKAVFVFSDGLDELSMTSLRDAVGDAVRGEILVYAAGVVERFPAGQPGREDLEVLARSTGGDAYFMTSARELPRIFRRVREHLLAQYALGFHPTPGPPGRREIEVRVRTGAFAVEARRSYEFVTDRSEEGMP
jgi:VWFA-related protein